MDRENVITHLQIIHTWAEFARERDLQFFTAKHLEDIAQWADDALELLKAQRETIDELISADKALKLLKEQEAANLYKCPNCGTWVSAENVVRCKDCIRYYANGGNCDQVLADWFCADGDRR